MKKILCVFFSFLLLLFCSSCISRKSNIDVEKLVEDLKSNIEYDGKLVLADNEDVRAFIDIDEKVKICVYHNSDVYCDEVGYFECPDEDTADKTMDAVKQYIDDEIFARENYNPKEVAKLRNTILLKYKNYVVFCVTADYSDAQKIIDKYID